MKKNRDQRDVVDHGGGAAQARGCRIGHEMDEQYPGTEHSRHIDRQEGQDRVATLAERRETGEIHEHRAGDEDADDGLLRLGIAPKGQVLDGLAEPFERDRDRGETGPRQRQAERGHEQAGRRQGRNVRRQNFRHQQRRRHGINRERDHDRAAACNKRRGRGRSGRLGPLCHKSLSGFPATVKRALPQCWAPISIVPLKRPKIYP